MSNRWDRKQYRQRWRIQITVLLPARISPKRSSKRLLKKNLLVVELDKKSQNGRRRAPCSEPLWRQHLARILTMIHHQEETTEVEMPSSQLQLWWSNMMIGQSANGATVSLMMRPQRGTPLCANRNLKQPRWRWREVQLLSRLARPPLEGSSVENWYALSKWCWDESARTLSLYNVEISVISTLFF